MRRLLILLLFFYGIGSLVICVTSTQKMKKAETLHRVAVQDYPDFADDGSLETLHTGLQRQIDWLKKSKKEQFYFGEMPVSRNRLLATLQLFQQKMAEKSSPEEFAQYIRENFALYKAVGRKKQHGAMLVTGYYEPVFDGALQETEQARSPIYRLPQDWHTQSRHWSRAEIENGNLLSGGELAWFNDPFDAYLLHIQGSGKIRLPDGTIRAVRFAGSNGHNYKSLGKLFVDKGIMPLHEVTVPAMRKWFSTHLDKMNSMLQYNPRFIFFKWGESQNPIGSSGLELTEGRSAAIDYSVLPAGTIAFLISRQPKFDMSGNHVGWNPLSRFVFPQDSGAAIKGSGLIDLFWGAGKYAEDAAGIMKERGELYFLLIHDTR